MDVAKLLTEIWQYSGGEKVYIAGAADGKWSEEGFSADIADRDMVANSIKRCSRDHEGHLQNVYFSPLSFNGARRNSNAVAPAVLFADLDPVHPEYLEVPRPSVAWATSPGMYQALWYLDRAVMDLEEWSSLNRGLTYTIRADKGGWHASKMLRVPGTINVKRRTVRQDAEIIPVGKLLWAKDTMYDPDTFREVVMETVVGVLADLDELPQEPSDPKDLEWLTKLYWDRLIPRAQALVVKGRVTDRSVNLWRLAQACAMSGLSREEAFALMSALPWNKFQDRPVKLWQDITKAYTEAG